MLLKFNLDEVKQIHVSSHEKDFIASNKFDRFAFSRKNIDYLNDRLNCDIISLIESEICYESLFTTNPVNGSIHHSLKYITSIYGDNQLLYPTNVNGVKLAKYITLYMLFLKGYIKVPGYAKSLSEYFDIYTYFGTMCKDCYILSCSYDTKVIYQINKTISSLTNTLVKDDIEIVEPAFKEERPELNLISYKDINLYASIHSYSDQLMPLSPDYIKPGNPYVEKKDIPNIQKRIDKVELSLAENYILKNNLYDYDENKYKDLYPVNGKDILKVFCDTFKYSKSYFNNIIPKEGFKFISIPNYGDELQVVETHTVSYPEACDFGNNIVYPRSENTFKLIKFLLIHHIYKSIKRYINATTFVPNQKYCDLINDFEKSGKTYAEDYFRIFYMHDTGEYCLETEDNSLIFKVPEGKSIFEIDYFDCEEKSNNTKSIKSIKKERKNMFKNKFGKINDTKLALSYDGKIAVANNKGDYVRYNMDTATVENIKNLVIDDNRFFFMVPISEVDIGDIIKYNDGYHQVTKINENNLAAINLSNNTIVNIVKETIFGMSFYSKVISLIDKDTFSDNNSLIMFMMMEDDDNMDMKELMMMQMFTNKDGKQNINPMMLALMMDDDDDDMFKTMLMMNMMNCDNGFDMSNIFQNPMMMMMLLKDDNGDNMGKMMKFMLMSQMMNNQKAVEPAKEEKKEKKNK